MNEELELWLLKMLDRYIEDSKKEAWVEDCICFLEECCQRAEEISEEEEKNDWRESGRLRRRILEVTKGGHLNGTLSEQEALHKTALWCQEQEDHEKKASALPFYLAEIDSCVASGQIKKAIGLKKQIAWLALHVDRFIRQPKSTGKKDPSDPL